MTVLMDMIANSSDPFAAFCAMMLLSMVAIVGFGIIIATPIVYALENRRPRRSRQSRRRTRLSY